MHGIIFTELRNYVTTGLGQDAWPTLLKEAGLDGKSYLPVKEYPDAEAGALVAAASRIAKKPTGATMEGFGIFLAPKLLTMGPRARWICPSQCRSFHQMPRSSTRFRPVPASR